MQGKIIFATAQQARVSHQTDAPVVAITYNQTGFHPIRTQAKVEDLNEPDATPEVIESAVFGSMFGWDTPAAERAVNYFAAH
jgi:hypothetical protein